MHCITLTQVVMQYVMVMNLTLKLELSFHHEELILSFYRNKSALVNI